MDKTNNPHLSCMNTLLGHCENLRKGSLKFVSAKMILLESNSTV